MIGFTTPRSRVAYAIVPAIATIALLSPLSATVASAQSQCAVAGQNAAVPGNLVVSLSAYTANTAVKVGQILPPGCTGTTGACAASTGAIAASNYPQVFNNSAYDPSFGISSKIYLYETTLNGQLVNAVEVPNSGDAGVTSTTDQLVTNFSAHNELGLHLSLDKNYLTMAGYVAPLNILDIEHSNTPADVDSTNPVNEKYYRAAIAVDKCGSYTVTETNAFSGGSPDTAILNNTGNNKIFYLAGNAGNGKTTPQAAGVIQGSGAQIATQATVIEANQNPAGPSPLGSFNDSAVGSPVDTIGKDDDFRAMTVYNNVVYLTKGSGANGINTVYFIDTTGHACSNGVGVPSATATLPTTAETYNASTLQTAGLPTNMCILKGFPTTPNKTASVVAHPFGLWFANPTTLYVADEGDGFVANSTLFSHAAAQTAAGLQKWVLNTSTNTWSKVYTLQAGLLLGTPYSISDYPTGNNSLTGLPWTPATDGLRNVTGLVGSNATASEGLPSGYAAIWGVTSTVSGSGDPGADPNKLMYVIDNIANTSSSVAAKEKFYTADYAAATAVIHGVSFTPGTTTITSF